MARMRTYPEGVPSWIELRQNDVDAAQEFYGGLLRWTFHEETTPSAPVRSLVARLDGRDVAGLSSAGPDAADAPRSTDWMTSVAVDDLDAALRRIVTAGGRIDAQPRDDGGGARVAGVADASGIAFGLRQAGARPGAQAVNEPGAWNFSDLHTDDPDGAVAFYDEVFGWEFDEIGYATLIRRPGYGDHLAATADPGIRERQAQVAVPQGFEDAIAWLAPLGANERPHWHVAFAVADRDASATIAERLGGAILSTTDTEWTREAIVRDPQGAVITVSQFAPSAG